MRQSRRDIFHETNGVLMEDGTRWHAIRSKVQQDLMRPQSAYFYLNDLQQISDDFVDFIRAKRSTNNGSIKDFLPEIYCFTFEAIAYVAMNVRLGCLQPEMDPELETIFQAVQTYLGSFQALRGSLAWKFLPPRWSKPYREAQDSFNLLLDFGKKRVEEAVKEIDRKPSNDSNEMSVLEKMIKRNGSKCTYPLVMALDLLFGGIDTTGNTLGFLMYHLAANPDKQEILRTECQRFGPNISVQDLNEMRYMRACIKETFRLTPTVSMLLRILQEDVTLQGYHIPKDTLALWSTFIFQQQFADHDKFIPERWMDKSNDISPYAVRLFSHGPRMCIGKRFAELELMSVTHKLMNNFQIEWMHSCPLTLSQVLVNVPDQTLDFRFKDI